MLSGFSTVLLPHQRVDMYVSNLSGPSSISDSLSIHRQDCNNCCIFLTHWAVNTGWQEIDINGCYSLVNIAFAPICTRKNNRRIWRHNVSISRSRIVSDWTVVTSQGQAEKSQKESEILFDNINHHHTHKKSISFTVKYLYSIQCTWSSTEQFIILPCSSNSNCDVVRGPH